VVPTERPRRQFRRAARTAGGRRHRPAVRGRRQRGPRRDGRRAPRFCACGRRRGGVLRSSASGTARLLWVQPVQPSSVIRRLSDSDLVAIAYPVSCRL
jgi:hypothetical protein